MTYIERDVMRQALIEYVTQRAGTFAFEGNADVRSYVNRRYSTLSQSFKDQKIESLTERVKVAISLVQGLEEQ